MKVSDYIGLRTVGKAFEAFVSNTLTAEMEEKGVPSEEQYEFSKGRQIFTAIRRVLEIAEIERRKTPQTRGICLAVLLFFQLN